jgi:putative transposase
MAESIVIKNFKFRIFPSKAQTTKLAQTLDLCRDLYNASLQERRDAYKLNRISLNYYDQANQLKEIKETNPEYKDVHSQISQDVLKRVDKAFQSFFRRVKQKQKAGFPRFQGKHKYNSFTFAQSGFSLTDNRLTLSKIGKVKLKLHRKIIGKVKTLTISRDSCDKWFACFSVESAKEILEATNKSVGCDVGITTFCTLSDGVEIDNPHFLKSDEKKLATAQKRLSKQIKGSKERCKKRKIVAKIHNRIKNRRSNFAHQVSRFLVNSYDQIFFEKLNILGMAKNHCLSKAILDAAWSQTIQYTDYKAENAGRFVGMVNPAYTSQDCSNCGNRQKMPLDVRLYGCSNCHISIGRDINAAINIKTLGLQSLGNQSLEATSKPCLVVE